MSTVVPHRRARRVGRILAIIAAVVSVALVAVSVAGYLVYRHLDGNITKAPLQISGPRPESGPAVNYVLIGSDTRAGEGDQQFQGTGAGEVTGARSDTTILMHLPAGSEKALLVSFPRDLVVPIPACDKPDGSQSKPQTTRFNAAFTLGGASCTVKTIEQLTDVRVDDYVEVDFASFQRIVDALGGVDICTPVPLDDPQGIKNGVGYGTGLHLSAGEHHLDGPTALAFVRARYGIGNGGDLGRIQRQQQFLAAVVRKATSTGLLLNPPKLYSFLDAATKSITTGSLSINDLRHLASRVKGLQPGKVTFITVPTKERGDGATLALAQPGANQLFAALRADEAVPGAEPAPSTRPDLTVPASRIKVRVLNGTGKSGAASQAAKDLRAAGFTVVQVADADATTYTETVVRYGPTRNESSQTLAASVSGAKRQLDGSLGSTLELVVGSDYHGAVKVTVGPASSPAPTTGSTASPSPLATTSADQDPCSS